jgi:hypothetical protein
MNITLSVDDHTVEQARKIAREQGTSLNELVRRFIAGLAGKGSGGDRARDLVALFAQHPGDSHGARITREDAYDERL